jgi:excisionase family DNA binding protein
MSINVNERLLTVPEVAERVGLSERQVWRKIRAGVLPAVQLGGRGSAVRVPADELEAWLRGPGGPA